MYFGPAEAERLREYIFLAGGSGTEPFSPTVRLGDSEWRVASESHLCPSESTSVQLIATLMRLRPPCTRRADRYVACP